MTELAPALTFANALAAGVLAQATARQARLPGIVVLLATGAALGPQGLAWVHPRALGEGLFWIVDFGVAIILFEGGLNLELSRLRREEAAIRRLITAGAVATFAGAAVAARFVLGWTWDLAMLFGSLVIVTGPTVVTPLLRDLRLRPRLRTVLEAEGVLIDPIGAVVAAVVLQIVLLPAASTIASGLRDLMVTLGVGLAAGLLGGLVLTGLLRLKTLVLQGYQNALALALVMLLFAICDELAPTSGVLAAPVAGIVVGNLEIPLYRDLKEFKDQMTVLLLGLLFVLLAADVGLDDVRALGLPGALVVALLILVIRPVSAWLATIRLDLSVRERIFIAWLAPRGIVAAAVASITAAALEAAGRDGGSELRALVFLTIAGTVVLAGVTARPVAALLGLRLPRRDRVLILGANGLGLALATRLRDAGVGVTFVDADPKRCRLAEDAGFPVVFGNALEERVLLRAQVELVGTAVGLTSNEHLNSLFAGQVSDLFAVPRVLVAVTSLYRDEPPPHLQRPNAAVLFDGPHDLERWDVRLRHSTASVETFVCAGASEAASSGESAPAEGVESPRGRARDRYVIVAIGRGSKWQPMHVGFAPRRADLAAVVLEAAERDDVIRLLADQGWMPAGEETEPLPPKEAAASAQP